MKSISFFLASFSISLFFSASLSAESEWIPLFDGSSTDAWRAYRGDNFPSDGWEIREDRLTSIGDGKHVDLITRETFTDFELELEWRVPKGANSGIFFRVNEEADLIWHFAPEYQILDDGPKTAPVHKTGTFYDILPTNDKKKLRPQGEFNQTKIVARGSKIEHWLNGEKILTYDLDDPELKEKIKKSKFGGYPKFAETKEGPIGLQHHGDTIDFRNIRIRRISSSNE